MIFGLSIHAFTQLHTAISLIGIAAGLIFLVGLLTGRWLGLPNLLFLVFTILTSVTGFFFPQAGATTPAQIVGVISLVDLAIACVALFVFHRAGKWRAVYTITAIIALWFNVFVLIVQSFLKIPALHVLAPNGNEPPFGAAQGITLIAFVVAGWFAVRKPVA
jgi:hypothetical protein